jgi:hypothetical protein
MRWLAALFTFFVLPGITLAQRQLPASVDLTPELRSFGLAPDVQGDRGDCTLFAVTALAEFEWARHVSPCRFSQEFLIWGADEASGSTGDQAMFFKAVHGLNVHVICDGVALLLNCQLDRKMVNQQNAFMKTTLDLPEDLVTQVKIRAVRERKKLKDAVAELLRKGLASTGTRKRSSRRVLIVKDKLTGLPLIQCEKAAKPGEEITPERIADILAAQEIDWYHAAGR